MRPSELNYLFSQITRIKGVGSNLATLLARLVPHNGVPLIRDVLFHLPVGVVDRRFTCPLREAPEGKVATFIVKVEAHQPPPAHGRGARKPYKVLCSNDTGDITLVFFHVKADYLNQALPVGQTRVISGRVERFDYQLQMPHPDVIAPLADLAKVQTVEPVYPLTESLTNRRLSNIIHQALGQSPGLPEWLAPETLERHRWSHWRDALAAAHAPASEADLSPGSAPRARLAYDEMMAYQLSLALARQRTKQRGGAAIKDSGDLRTRLLAGLPFRPTAGQEQVLKEIAEDMASGERMARLLQGDVGSGKTLVAMLSMLVAAECGFQAALMAPTELIARQHFDNWAALLGGIGVNAVLLTGAVKGRACEEALAAIAGGDAAIVIGTHALFQEHVAFRRLGLIVVDEQHRFGVAQRMALARKGDRPHLLHMTATPIPRSLTMTLYGDMDCSLLTEKPVGRRKIDTRVIPLSRREDVLERLGGALGRGEKVYWICPMIENGDEALLGKDLATARERFAEFRARFGENVGMVHGRMKPEERVEAMQRFAASPSGLLVATTVVEVGVDVKDATILIVEQAERFGLSQLHQLRGRVGRGSKPSACVLLYSDAAGEEARARLRVLRETDDGFRIAEEDMRLRGGGDILGTRQSGLPEFRLFDFVAHEPLIYEARDEVKAAMADDSGLHTPRGAALRQLLYLFDHETEAEHSVPQEAAG